MTSLSFPINSHYMKTREASPKAQVGWGLSCHLAASARVKGVPKCSTFKDSSLQMCQSQVPRLCTRCDPWELRWGKSLEHTAADDEVISTIRGMDEFTGEREKKNVTFLFSCLKSLSFRVQEGIVALTLFSRRRVAACQRQLHAGSFALHAVSGFKGKLFLSLDHLLL